MLLPFKGPIDWSDYCNYLKHYYKHHCSVIAEVTGCSLVIAAETCLKKEGELVSLWDRKMKECTDEILSQNTFILSSLIQEFADKVKHTGEGLSDVSTAALLCITKEADLICEMLSCDVKPDVYLIIESTEIRMCALSLMNHQLCDSVAAAAAMVGIMKETTKICDWMSENHKPFDAFDMDLDNDFELGRQVRQGTLYLMISMLERSPFSVSAAAGHKPVKEKSFSGNIPRNDGNDIAPADAANITGGNTQDQEKITGADSKKRGVEDADKEANDRAELGSCQSGAKLRKRGGRHHNLGHGDDHGVPLRLEYLHTSLDDMAICAGEHRMAFDSSFEDLEEGDDARTVLPVGIVYVFEKTWGWDRLLPLKSHIEWSDYCNYLRQYYKRNSSVVADVAGSLVASAEVCIKKEEELVSLWKTRVVTFPGDLLVVNTIVQSNLIQERAHSIIFASEGELPVASTVALACIGKEADLICELLKHGAEPTGDIIHQSSVIRLCALSLMHLQGSHAIDAAAAMMGISKECKLMCNWIKKEDKLITFNMFPRQLEECRLIRTRTLDVMLSILKGSSFPSSKMWLDLVANN
ncbi:unnamed protein product [Urochloa humidicola]